MSVIFRNMPERTTMVALHFKLTGSVFFAKPFRTLRSHLCCEGKIRPSYPRVFSYQLHLPPNPKTKNPQL